MTKFFVQSLDVPDRRFEIVALDRETMQATLRGTNAEFTTGVDNESLQRRRYKIIKVTETENDHAQQS